MRYLSQLLKLNDLKSRRMSLTFTQKLNPLLGENTWEWQDEDYDYHQEIARSSYADMLHDTERNQKYNDALKLAINKMHAMGKKAKVLDIGTGTGLLSMMAVRNGADSVIACEAFEPMSNCAKEIVNLNGFRDKITVIYKHSNNLTVGETGDLPEKANILVTEVFDTELIGEGALSTISHARENLLENDCIIVPNSATIYVQIIESPLAQNWNKFRDFCDENGRVIMEIPSKIKACQGAAAVHDIQLSQLPKDSFKQIVPPQPVFHFNWSGPLRFDECTKFKFKTECDGTAQIIFMWWDLKMDTENKIILSCAPYWAHPLKEQNPNLSAADIPWRDHWMQALYYLPYEQSFRHGEDLTLVCCHDEFSLWFYLDANTVKPLELLKPICECTLHVAHSRTRIGQLNDDTRNQKYLSIIKQHVNNESVVLLLSDGFYLGLAAAKYGAKKILYLDDNYISTHALKEFIKTNRLTNVEIIDNTENLKRNESIKDVTLVLGQPYFKTTILPWDSLYFGYLIKSIQGILPESAVIAPKIAKLYGMVVEFKDLQKIRFPLEAFGEIDLKPFDDLLLKTTPKCDANVEAQPLWEYPCVARSAVVEIAKLNIPDLFSSKISSEGFFELQENSSYNAVVLWMDWDFNGDENTIISTGPTVPPVIGQQVEWDMHTRQGVHFLLHKSKNMILYQFNYIIEEGRLHFMFC